MPIMPVISSARMFELRGITKVNDKTIPDEKRAEIEAKNRKELEAQMRSELPGEGHVFANIGVSSILTTSYKGKDYVILAWANRKSPWNDFNEKFAVAKTIAGYMEAQNTANPINAIKKELEEEVLLVTQDGKILPGVMDGKPLEMPFKGEKPLFKYEDQAEIRISTINGTDQYRKVLIDGKEVAGNPDIYFHVGSDSAQLVFRQHIQFTPDESALEKLCVSFDHSEDKRTEDKQSLNTFYHPRGLILVELDKGKMTNNAYTFSEGKLVQLKAGIQLSETFAPRTDDNIVTMDNVKLESIVELQNRA